MASGEGNASIYKMVSSNNAETIIVFISFGVFTCMSFNSLCVFQTPLDNDINQHFQDAIDVLQQHSNDPYYDSGKESFLTYNPTTKLLTLTELNNNGHLCVCRLHVL